MAGPESPDRLIDPMREQPRTTTTARHYRPPVAGAGLGYRPALDGLRGVAIAAVLAYHFGVPGAGGGFLGVDLFFVLSGFLIASLLAGEFATTGRIDLLRFWARRARRLLPALLVVAVGIAIWTRVAGDWDTWGLRRDELLATLGYVANWHLVGANSDYFAAAAGASPLQHTWSLGIEEQFYLLWPVIFLVAVRLGGRRRMVPIALASLLVIASVVAAAVLFDPASPSRAYYGTDTRIHQILVGVVLGLAMRPWRRAQAVRLRERRALAIAQVPLSLILLAGFVLADPTDGLYYRGGSLMLALVAAGLIFTIERAPTGPVARLLSTRPLVAAGVISYGLYLWHWPVVVATAPADATADALSLVALRLALTVGLAAAMYVAVERPIREGRLPVIRRSSWRTLSAAAAAIAIAAGISLQATDLGAPAGVAASGETAAPAAAAVTSGATSGATAGATSGVAAPGETAAPAEVAALATAGERAADPTDVLRTSDDSLSVSFAKPVEDAGGTAAPTATPDSAPSLGQGEVAASMADFAHWQCPTNSSVCTRVPAPEGSLTVVTFGDSSIGSLDVGLTEWARSNGVGYVVAASGGCTVSGQPRSNDATRVRKGSMDAKCEARYNAIVDQVASLRGPLLVLATAVSEYRPIVLLDGSVTPFDTADHRAAVESGIEAFVQRLDRPDATVVLLGPAGHTLKPKCQVPDADACSLAGYTQEWSAQATIAGIYAEVSARHTGRVRFAQLTDLVCPQGGPCSSWRGDTLVRWDGIHYTRPGSRLIVADLMARLRTLGIRFP